MFQLEESQSGCKVSFSHDMRLDVQTHPIKGTIYLFEHTYDEFLPTFWYGVIELPCTLDVQDMIKTVPPYGIRITVVLDNGRKGVARYTGSHIYENTARIGVIGLHNLK